MKGLSHIYSYPFRIYGTPSLPLLQGHSKGNHYRVRVYPPFSARKQGTPLSPDVPISEWPDFEWNARVPPEDRLLPPTGFQVGPDGQPFDALRMDFWGSDPYAYSQRFEPLLITWLRYLTGQDWVGAFEVHTDSRRKYEFEIDTEGKALLRPVATLDAIRTQGAHMRLLDSDLFGRAFIYSLAEDNPPLQWLLWQDASLYRAMNRMKETILSLVLSLEVARHTVFPRFARTKAEPGLGAVLLPPFDGTDLLRHLSSALEKARNRNLQKEEPKIWTRVEQLYVARHHIAHGRPPVYRSRSGLKKVNDQDFTTWSKDVFSALQWIEGL